MGGYGSGSRINCKNTVEDGKKLSISTIAGSDDFKNVIEGNLKYSVAWVKWIDSNSGESNGSISYFIKKENSDLVLNLVYTHTSNWSGESNSMNYDVKLIELHRFKRGKVYLFECPLCRKYRGFKLYSSGSKYFACRKCLKLNYQSSKDSRKFDGMFSMLAKDTGFSVKIVKESLRRFLVKSEI